MTRPVIIIGSGGHAAVLIDLLLRNSFQILGMTDTQPSRKGVDVLGIPVLGGDDVLRKFPPESVEMVNGVGSIQPATKRESIFLCFKEKGYHFASAIHPQAVIGREVTLGEGVQIMAGAILQTRCRIGENTIINTGAILDHDCIIGSHAHVAPGAILSGGVRVGNGAHIGAGSSVIQNVTIGDSALIAAGAVVVRNVAADAVARGVPARVIR